MTIRTESAAANPRVLACDVYCPDGHHGTNQEWTASELRRLLDSQEPLFHCDAHSYRWNPDAREVATLRHVANELGEARVN